MKRMWAPEAETRVSIPALQVMGQARLPKGQRPSITIHPAVAVGDAMPAMDSCSELTRGGNIPQNKHSACYSHISYDPRCYQYSQNHDNDPKGSSPVKN